MSWGIEQIINAVETYLKANLGTKLTAINTENGDSILDSISSAAYYKQFIDSEPNYDPFIVMGVIEAKVNDNVYQVVNQNYSVDVIIFFETVDAETDYKRVFRYQKALLEVLGEGFNDIFRQKKIAVTGLAPVTVQITKNSQLHRATGVSLEVSIT
jgi:hypothetical protein